MQALVVENRRVQFLCDRDPPTPRPGEVEVEVIQAGICETDLQLARGYLNFTGVLGHEFVGIAKSGTFATRRVVGEINCNCRNCPRCAAGLGNHCGNRTTIGIDRHDGAFAETVCVPEHCLHEVPESVSDDEAVFTEPLAAAFQIQQQVPLAADQRAAILGDGRLAYLSAQTVALAVNHVEVIGKHLSKLSRFDELGMTTTLLNELRPEKSFDLVVDCTGSPTGLPLAIQLVKPRGTIVMKTTVAGEHQLSLAPIVIDEINLVGSRCGPFDRALDSLAHREINVASLITHRFALQDGAEAMQTAASPEAFKVVLEMGRG